MSRRQTVSVPKSELLLLLKDCMKRKGLHMSELARRLGRSVSTVYNNFTDNDKPMTMSALGKICAALDYPIEDILNGHPYADPNSQEALKRNLQKAVKRIETLEEEVRRLKEISGQLTT